MEERRAVFQVLASIMGTLLPNGEGYVVYMSAQVEGEGTFGGQSPSQSKCDSKKQR